VDWPKPWRHAEREHGAGILTHRRLLSSLSPIGLLRNVCLPPICGHSAHVAVCLNGQAFGVPHTDYELAKLSREELEAELQRSRVRLTTAGSAKMSKQWHKRVHSLEGALAKRD
jgi:hypothetical protein